MNEVNISDLSQKGSFKPPEIKNKKPRNYRLVLIPIIIIVIALYFINRVMWNNYYDKYYEYFIDKNNIDVSSIDQMSSWGYVPYKFKGADITLEFHKPQKGSYTFAVGLLSEYGEITDYWEVPFNECKYVYEFCIDIDRFGKRDYTIFFDTYEFSMNSSYECFGIEIKEDGTFIYDSDGFSEMTDENRKVIEYHRDDILDLKSEVEKIIS